MEPETEREKGDREREGSQRDIGAIDGEREGGEGRRRQSEGYWSHRRRERRGRGKEKAVREILEP